MEIEYYDSSDNVQNTNNTKKQSGSINFKIPNNKSGKLKITFTNKYDVIPKIISVLSVNNGNVFDILHAIEKLDNTGFVLHLCNKDLINEITGSFNFWVEQF